MKKNIFLKIGFFLGLLMLVIMACKQEEYSLGELKQPSDLTIDAVLVGQDTENPYGDGSGVVNITAKADNAITYKIAYALVGDNISSDASYEVMPRGEATKKFNKLGVNNYRITVVAYGAGGTSTVASKEITVRSVYNPDSAIVTALTGNTSKTWKVDAATAGHFGVGPWSDTSVTPEWWSASPNEKATCCNCFYTARYTFKQVGSTDFQLDVNAPDGVLTKTGDLTTLPGIPSSGDEGCYTQYTDGSSAFSFIASTTGVADNVSTRTSILLDGNDTYIGYGSFLKEYEILEINENYLYLRVQGTETGNAWYLKLVPAE